MREWLNRADSKSVVPFFGTEGSNPSLSDSKNTTLPPTQHSPILQDIEVDSNICSDCSATELKRIACKKYDSTRNTIPAPISTRKQ